VWYNHCMKRKHNDKAIKHVYVSERVHYALNSEAARQGMTVNEYLAWILAARAPDALFEAERALRRKREREREKDK